MSFPISLAIFEKSLLFPVFAFPWPLRRRCFCSGFEGYEERLRIDSTHALNSCVLSCTGMLSMPELLFVNLVNETSGSCQRRKRSQVQGLLCTSSGAMDQGGLPSPSSSPSAGRIQFPTDLTAPDPQRPAKRGLPRVGSNPRVPGSHSPRSIPLGVTATHRERTRSMESSSSKYGTLGILNPMPRTTPHRSPNTPSPLNPARRTRAVTHTGRREKESTPQPFDPTLYDLNNTLAQPDGFGE